MIGIQSCSWLLQMDQKGENICNSFQLDQPWTISDGCFSNPAMNVGLSGRQHLWQET